MKIYTDEEEVVVPEVTKGAARKLDSEKAVKFVVTDTDGEVWTEYLTHKEVADYHKKGYKLSQVYFWQFWR